MEIKKGDLVAGIKPWNNFTRIGVVISEPIPSSCDHPKCRVYWYAPEPGSKFAAGSKFLTSKTFVLEELVSSIEKMEKDSVR